MHARARAPLNERPTQIVVVLTRLLAKHVTISASVDMIDSEAVSEQGEIGLIYALYYDLLS